MKTLVTLFALVSLGCEDKLGYFDTDFGYDIIPLRIDAACSDLDTQVIVEGVERLNDWANRHVCQDMIDLQEGFYDVDHEDPYTPDEFIVCYYGKPEWLTGGQLGTGGWHTKVRLFLYRIPEATFNYRLALVMHELGHYIGLQHADPPAIMHVGPDSQITHFTGKDTEKLCDTYECAQ